MSANSIRNFCIIAHVDHGKSTLSDRILELCGLVDKRNMRAQYLDRLDLERERGITIKAQCVTLPYESGGEKYRFNLIDTPGHVDFSYEVSRSLAACEGAVLLVDASQGVQAQTVAHCYAATTEGLEIVPVLNKMDLAHADPERACQEIEEIIGLDTEGILQVSGRTGQGVVELLDRVITAIPPAQTMPDAPFKALIVDSWFDSHRGVISLVRVAEGCLRKGDLLRLQSTGHSFHAEQVGVFAPDLTEQPALQSGEVGFLITGIKDLRAVPVGDTLVEASNKDISVLPGFERPLPRVFAAFFPTDSEDFEAFSRALDKLKLNDAALHCEPEVSDALGHGYRCGFLGSLHMEVTLGRLEGEFGMNLMVTAPTVEYEVLTTDGKTQRVSSPARLPEPSRISEIREPIARASILAPVDIVGRVLALCRERRGVVQQEKYAGKQVSLEVLLPLAEIVVDFFDHLKSQTRGLASLDYRVSHFEASQVQRLDILVNGEIVDAMSTVVHRSHAMPRGRLLAQRMVEVIPRQMFEVSVQAAIGGKILARETVRAMRKNVTSKCYGGDISRKRKLLEKQKAGKKRMKALGKVQIPQDAFLNALRSR